jgi:hypothetical protein
MATMESAGTASTTLVKMATVPPEARPLLEELLVGPRSDVAGAAATVLEKVMGGTVPDVPVALQLERIRGELSSPHPDRRSSGVFAAKRLGTGAAPVIPDLRAAGERIAGDASIEAKAALSLIREALLAIGCAVDDLPRPPSRLEGYRGSTPRAKATVGAYVIGDIAGFVRHGVVSVPVSSLGLWDDATGKRLFVIDGAQLLAQVPAREQAAVIRTQLRPDAKHGGTSRADVEWYFERYAIPSGDRVASLRLPDRVCGGWPAHLDVSGTTATILVGDEDAPFEFDVELDDLEDRLVPGERPITTR